MAHFSKHNMQILSLIRSCGPLSISLLDLVYCVVFIYISDFKTMQFKCSDNLLDDAIASYVNKTSVHLEVIQSSLMSILSNIFASTQLFII